SASTHSRINAPRVLLDPFCGMGTILAEALFTGWSVVGSDQSAEVVDKARKNLEWLSAIPGVAKDWKVFVSDAAHVSDHLMKQSLDAIVTEPFLGEARRIMRQKSIVNSKGMNNILKGLEKLYIGCLREWHLVLKPEGKVVIALPEYAIGDTTYVVKNVIDRCENLGYTVSAGPLVYSRPQAVVRRKFFVLTKK
ncbi:methyltransferase domain-containing protein, partial [Candidatus Gottesmanbacteria bacterium]|nr:methyltransferase domain-containing protein [Candidatus Gottesmanbacteria bacterium]